MNREERDLTVRWVRQMRHEPLPTRARRTLEAIYARLCAINPHSLPSEPSPRNAVPAHFETAAAP